GARDPGKAGEPPARINVWGRAPWNETWGDSFDPEWTAGERGRHRATHAEPARPTRRAPEVFPYAHKDAAFSFTAVPEHRQPTECSWAANPTTVELDGPPSWAAFFAPRRHDARSPTSPTSLRPVGRWRQWPRGWAATQAAGPESGGGRGWRREAVRRSAGRAGGACPWGDAAPRRRPPVGVLCDDRPARHRHGSARPAGRPASVLPDVGVQSPVKK